MKFIRTLLAACIGLVPVVSAALSLEQTPLFIASTEPRVMLVASRDHQLSIKAYTDYSDLDNDGVLDTTYKDSFAYYGYFDSDKCYSYSSGLYVPSGAVTSGTHQCGGTTWSGNFLNWASMTRMDVLRKTFYGGYRSTDTTTVTVLERHFLPDDVHAFVKVYTPSGGMPSIQALTGISGQTSISLCNVSNSTSSTLTGLMTTLPDPKIRVASGSWPQWDSSEVTQCALSGGTQPTAVLNDYNARVKVCVSGSLEANCKAYTHPTTSAQTVKPTGLLQKYGDADADRRVRFGLMTGSYAANKSGGVLRKNTALLANNNGTNLTSSSVCGDNNANDEIDVCTGQFINQAANQAGIINTLNRLRIAGFKYSTNKHEYSCNSPGITSFSDGECVDWGNPLSEIYLESLRYFSNAGPTTAFDVSDASILASIPKVVWSDPLPSTEWCATSSIVLLSTGLNSFDTNQLASFTPSGGSSVNALTLTQTVGDSSHENINGGTYLIGDNGSSSNNQCTAKVVSNLATAKGICPEVPSTEGGYGIAGLAYAPKIQDLRPGYSANRTARWGGTVNPINPDWALRQPINTYAVQLAESLPSFSPTVGSGTVSLLPACQANSSSSAAAWTSTASGWRNCSMTNLIVNPNVAMANVGTDASAKTKTCSGNGTTAQCFTVSWEDSTWGNDYDMDGIQRLGYCVGSACSSFKMLCPTTASATATLGPWAGVASNNIVIASCAVQANAGHTLTFGYTLSGTFSDGAYYPVLRPGNKNFNVGSVLATGITAPDSSTFVQGTSVAKLLKNPLWYAAKYGSFTESTPTSGTPNPDLQSEWDKVDNNTGLPALSGPCMPGDCVPDSYYDVKNPANLYTAMSNIFDAASVPDAAASSVATNTANLQVDNYIFQAKFQPSNWSGQLVSYRLDTSSGVVVLTQKWDAAPRLDMQTPSSRVILTKGPTDGVSFEWSNLTVGQQTLLNTNYLGLNDGLGSSRLDYLRGIDTNEGTGAGQFRERNKAAADGSVLGDIVNSGPLFVGAPNAGYSDIDHPGYAAFRTRYTNRKPVVYVGANDGMLHGFDAQLDSSGNPVATGGDELIAYVPSQVYGNLSRLTAQNYNRNHRYLVDGTPMAADAYLNLASLGSNDEDKWRTVLIGSMNSGGKGYFALDITNPNLGSEPAPTFSSANAANVLLWEFTDADDPDMGYAYNLPPQYSGNSQAKQIVKLQDGKWAVIVGNGYNSAGALSKAVLYVLYIENGVDGSWASTGDFIKIVADTGPNNGLSTPVPYDSDGDGMVDVAYAGDLKGNMWKFNLSTPSSPTVSLLFSGGSTKPITTPPEVLSHPSGGNMVLFGTGKYLELTDNANADQQTLYGVRDTNSGTVLASELQNQTMDAATRIVSAGASVLPLKGWSINLPVSKERMTGIPKLVSGLFFFNTLIPSDSACESGGTGWIGSVDGLTGTTPGFPVFDINNDGIFDSSDLSMGGIQIGAALGGTTFIRGAPGSSVGVGIASLTSGKLGTPTINFGPLSGGRVNWREILQ